MKMNILVALLLVLALILCGCSGGKEEAYRMIQVLEVSGSVSVEREAMGTLDAYEGMRLESGDRITVGGESWLKIKMDEDKFALVEPGSILRLEASGSSADSKTVLHLEAGAVSSRLESKLGDGASYEVNTPNSTMAVRGTVFRVEVIIDEDGVSIANVSVYGESVAARLIHPDGSVDPEHSAVLIVEGTTAQVWGNEILSRYVTTDSRLELGDLQRKTLEFLQESAASGENLQVSQEELKELIDALEQSTSEEPTQEMSAPAEETTEVTEETVEATEEPTQPTTAPAAPRPTAPPATSPPAPVETEPPAATEAPTEAPTLPTYTVTFQYGGKTFATQTVTSGETAAAPKLQPTPSGSWTGIGNAITGDITISWSAN